MAITATHYELLKSLPVQHGSTLLEIGEANWYGDLNPEVIYVDHCRRETPSELANSLPGVIKSGNLFAIAKQFYEAWFSPSKSVAIDWNGSENALRLDLNGGGDLGERFDVVINHGTAEHIFNIGQVFKTTHEHCEVDGWMIHDSPFTGWIDHGFYCLQPTLFYDLAHANCYEIAKVAIHESKSRYIRTVASRDDVREDAIPDNSMLFVAYRKRFDTEFRIPWQGYYAGALSQSGSKAWEKR